MKNQTVFQKHENRSKNGYKARAHTHTLNGRSTIYSFQLKWATAYNTLRWLSALSIPILESFKRQAIYLYGIDFCVGIWGCVRCGETKRVKVKRAQPFLIEMSRKANFLFKLQKKPRKYQTVKCTLRIRWLYLYSIPLMANDMKYLVIHQISAKCATYYASLSHTHSHALTHKKVSKMNLIT